VDCHHRQLTPATGGVNEGLAHQLRSIGIELKSLWYFSNSFLGSLA
jgi:hypothetical protein